MKKLVLTFSLIIFGLASFSQSLALTYEGNPVAPNSSIMVILDPADEVATINVFCTNNNSAALSVKTKKIIHEGDTLPGTSNYFCWGACFPPFVYESGGLMIEPGATSEEFSADYEPHMVPGISTITYVFFDENNPDDSIGFTVDWNASPASLDEDLLSQVRFSAAYPNPASSVARVDYQFPEGLENSTVLVSNLLGATVREIPVGNTHGLLEIPVYDLPEGIYFYTLKTKNNLAITKKFVVRH